MVRKMLPAAPSVLLEVATILRKVGQLLETLIELKTRVREV
jgi:hypothetical protein